MISSEEVELYDRQIRIWGIEAQRRLRNSTVLITGSRGISAEVAKNLALAGFGKIKIAIDSKAEQGQGCFFNMDLYRDQVAELNPNVTVEKIIGNWQDQSMDCVVLAGNESIEQWIYANRWCRKNGVKLFCACQMGIYGFIMVDMIEYEFMMKNDPSSKQKVEYVDLEKLLGLRKEEFEGKTKKKALNRAGKLYAGLLQVLGVQNYNVDSDLKKNLEEMKGKESPAICSVLGGLLAQEVLKTVTRDSAPLKNVVVFNGLTTEAVVLDLS
jgi:ubiquitin-like 1-activating enzyme E1 A